MLEPFSKRAERQFWESNLRFKGKSGLFSRFFQSLSQNPVGFGKGSGYSFFIVCEIKK
jgi:hypothetical protein